MFKTMNRTVLDGMLGFTGGVMVCGQFWSLLAPAIEMTGGEGFAKVIPAAFFFLVRSSFSESIKCCRICTSILKLPKESNHHGNDTTLVSAITLHNIQRIGGWVLLVE
jgi:ZIP family zinc transporter